MQERSEIRQLADVFGMVTGKFLVDTERKVTLAHAIPDRAALVKEQIKLEVIKALRQVFQVNYYQITGEDAWS